MDIHFYLKGKAGRIHKVHDQHATVARRVYEAHVQILGHPLTTYYRVTVIDTMRGVAVLDSDNVWRGK